MLTLDLHKLGLEHYQLKKVILVKSKGGTGELWMCRDKNLHSAQALKSVSWF